MPLFSAVQILKTVARAGLILHLCLKSIYGMAEVVTDGSLGNAANLSGPDFQIGQDLGSRVGNNLFHSFSRFNLNSAESATFTGDSAIRNVISRVTGGAASSIDGLLKSEVGQADFYFVNPAGIVFGANARIDVPAAFHASSAAELKFADGAAFSATNPDGSRLTMATPDSFGFLNNQTGEITVSGSNLQFKPGTTAAFSGADLTIDRAAISGENLQLQLIANGSEEREISIQNLPDQALQGSINITGSFIANAGSGAEQVQIRGGNTLIQNSTIAATNLGVTNHIESPAVEIYVKDLQIPGQAVVTSGASSQGNSGDIFIHSDEEIALQNGSFINSGAFASGNAGQVTIEADSLVIDGQGSGAGIFSNAFQGSDGNAGAVTISSPGLVSIRNGSQINSSTLALGQAGNVSVEAGELRIDGQGATQITGIFTDATAGSSGNAGAVNVTSTGLLSVLNAGVISSSTFALGNAGSVTVEAGDLLIDRQEAPSPTGIVSLAMDGSSGSAGSVSLISPGSVSVLHGGQISSSTFATGDAGSVTLHASDVFLDQQGSSEFTGISSTAQVNSTGNAGAVSVNSTGLLSIVNGGGITSSTYALGNAGSVTVNARDLVINRQQASRDTGIFSDAINGSAGHAGPVNVASSGMLKVLNGGEIRSDTFALGNAGSITINAGEILVDRQDSTQFTGISSAAKNGSSGQAGAVTVNSPGLLAVVNGGQISSSTFALGKAGSVSVNAAEILVDGQQTDRITGIFSQANPGAMGSAGMVSVTSPGLLSVVDGGEISSSTFAAGDAGNVKINASDILIDGQNNPSKVTGIFSQTNPGASGKAGLVNVSAKGSLSINNGGRIRSSTFASGDAGSVMVDAGQIVVDGQGNSETDIGSQAFTQSSGDAGNVTVISDSLLSVINGGKISSATEGTGNAGSVTVDAAGLRVSGQRSQITSSAQNPASGMVGSVNVNVERGNITIADGGKISISSAAVLNPPAASVHANGGPVTVSAATEITPDSSINLNANTLSLNNGEITAEATGNVAASAIFIESDILTLNNSRINTSAQDGDGGPISVNAGRDASLRNSQLTTSVAGITGDGGDILITTPVLVLDGGFIQANTAAADAAGGDINLLTQALIPSRNSLDVGGGELLGFNAGSRQNVIQAAAPNGVSGTITRTDPELNIAGTLARIDTTGPDLGRIGRDPCSPSVQQNTLKTLGRGALEHFLKGQSLQTLENLLHKNPAKSNHDADKQSSIMAPQPSRRVSKPGGLLASDDQSDCQTGLLPPVATVTRTGSSTALSRTTP